jgi:hypothetical protein
MEKTRKEKLQEIIDKRNPALMINKLQADKTLAELVLKMDSIIGPKGDDGHTPIKGKDYFTEQELSSFASFIQSKITLPKDGYTPIKGKDYRDGVDGIDAVVNYDKIIKETLSKIKLPQDGVSPKIEDIASLVVKELDNKPISKDIVTKNELVDFLRRGGFRGGGISSVAHDNTLSGSGTDADPLKVVGGGLGGGQVDTVVAGTGISVNSTDPANPIVTNSAPDQTVSITAGTNITSVTGTYPNFIINAATQGGGGVGDMLKATYDPAGGNKQVAFSADLGTAAAQNVGYFATAAQGALAGTSWQLNGNTLGAKKTFGSIDNQDIGLITNNTERLTVLNNGNVGIGTTGPTAKLQISGSSVTGDFVITNSSSAGSISVASLLASSAAGDTYFSVGRALSSGNAALIGHSIAGGGYYAFLTTYGRPASDLAVYNTGNVQIGSTLSVGSATAPTGGVAYFNGNVGIGATAPLAKLQISGSAGQTTANFTDAGSTSDALFLDSNSSGAGNGGVILFGGKDAKWFAGIKSLLTDGTTNTIGDLAFSTRNAIADVALTERMRILANGNVGIGTTSPSGRLHLAAGTATASTAPLKFTSGTLLTTAEAGAVEFLTDAWYGTITTGAARKTFAFLESPTFTGTVTAPTFIGALTGTASGNLTSASTLDASKLSGAIPSAVTATTQLANDNSTNLATTAYVEPYANQHLYQQAIINGNFDVWQRGTSSTTNASLAADRWSLFLNGTSNTVSRQPFIVGQTVVPNNPTYYVRNVVTSSAGTSNYTLFNYRGIENVNNFSGQNITLSFWAKADANKNIALELNQNFGTGGSPSSVVHFGSQLIALTTTWTKNTITIAVPSITGKTLGSDNNSSMDINFWLDAGSDFNTRTSSLGQQSGTFEFAQVQLNAGSVALPFQPKSYADELRDCQRYYWRMNADVPLGHFATGYNVTTTTALFVVPYEVQMRTSPTFSSSAPATFNIGPTGIAGTVVTIDTTSKSASSIIFTVASGLTVNGGSRVFSDGVGSAYLGFSAEL